MLRTTGMHAPGEAVHPCTTHGGAPEVDGDERVGAGGVPRAHERLEGARGAHVLLVPLRGPPGLLRVRDVGMEPLMMSHHTLFTRVCRCSESRAAMRGTVRAVHGASMRTHPIVGRVLEYVPQADRGLLPCAVGVLQHRTACSVASSSLQQQHPRSSQLEHRTMHYTPALCHDPLLLTVEQVLASGPARHGGRVHRAAPRHAREAPGGAAQAPTCCSQESLAYRICQLAVVVSTSARASSRRLSIRRSVLCTICARTCPQAAHRLTSACGSPILRRPLCAVQEGRMQVHAGVSCACRRAGTPACMQGG